MPPKLDVMKLKPDFEMTAVQVLCDSAKDGLEVLREIGQNGVFLSVREEFASLAEAGAFLDEFARS